MNGNDYIYMLILMGLVTFIPRWVPIFFLSDRKLPDWLIRWLDLIPVSILSALLLPALITHEVAHGEPKALDILRPEMIVAIPTFIFALKTKSLGGTVFVGMLLYWLYNLMPL